jgi:hypothetical protein
MKYPLLLVGICTTGIGLAQQNTVASGGDASGSGGSVSYSIGQIDYLAPSGATGKLTEGVQQPFEIFEVVGLAENIPGISASLYPNPAVTSVILSMDASLSGQPMEFRITDGSGKLVRNGSVTETETLIDVHDLADAIYYLDVIVGDRIAKSFKLVKNQ